MGDGRACGGLWVRVKLRSVPFMGVYVVLGNEVISTCIFLTVCVCMNDAVHDCLCTNLSRC